MVQLAHQVADLAWPALGAAAALATALLGLLFADFASGCIHFYLANYATPRTPLFGRMAREFERHHLDMNDLLRQELASVSYPTARLTLLALALLLALAPPYWLASIALTALLGLGFSQAFHWWAHRPPGVSPPPGGVRWLQRRGLLLSHEAHVRGHHRAPFERCYAIVTGHSNGLLDGSRFWRRLEAAIHRHLGREPNCWHHEPALRRLALGEPSPRSSGR